MKKIDSHQHFWEYDPQRHAWINDEMNVLKQDFLPPDLKEQLDQAGFNGCVAVQADQTRQETDFLLQLADQFDFVKGIVGWLDICADDFKERLHEYTQNTALKGLRHVVQDEPDDRFLMRSDFLRGIQTMTNFDLTYDILIFERHLPVAIEFAEQFPDHSFVLDHIAKPRIKEQKIKRWEQGIRELAQHPTMYCKVSGLVTEADWETWSTDDLKPYLDVVFDAFGSERLMFGSDWPVCMLAANYQQVVKIVEDYIGEFTEEEQAKIMGGNARRFYGL